MISPLLYHISIHAPRGGSDCNNTQNLIHDMCKLLIFSEIVRIIYETSCDFYGLIIIRRQNFIKIPVRTFLKIFVRFRFALHHQDPFSIIAGLCTNLFDLRMIPISQIVKTQAVLLGIDQLF